MHTKVESFCVGPVATIKRALEKINECTLGIVLVVDEDRRLLGTVTDGDVRRAILAGVDLSSAVTVVLERKAGSVHARPLTAKTGTDRGEYLALLKKHQLLHLPILDGEGRVLGLITRDDFLSDPLPLSAVVMAGGKGTRLHPLTENLPKPMLHVGDKPLLEIIIGRLKQTGIRQVHVTTHHKPERITEHFGDGENFGVDLRYVSEEKPLGTAGALGLMPRPKETLLVINGDILTDVDFKAMYHFHREHRADLTVAVREYDLKVPYGVLECEGEVVKCLQEKPVRKFLVNAGIYLMEPSVHGYITKGHRQDMTDLIQTLLNEKLSVISFPVYEYWLDIGGAVEYQAAQNEAGKFN